MTSIIDDFTNIYRTITDDIIEIKKNECNKKINDKGFDCDTGDFEITDIDINSRMNSNNYSFDNIRNYKKRIEESGNLFIKNFNIEDNDDEEPQYITHIDTQISSFQNNKNNYESVDTYLILVRNIILAYIAKIFVFDFIFGGNILTQKRQSTLERYENFKEEHKGRYDRHKRKYQILGFGQDIVSTFGEMFLCKADEYIINGLVIGSIVWLIFAYIENRIKLRINDLGKKITKLQQIKDDDINKLIKNITELSVNIDNDDDSFNNNIKEIVREYKRIKDKNLTNNRFSKNDKIKNMNVFFDDIKHIIQVNDNRFNEMIIDNQDQIICLMKLLTHKGTTNGNDCKNDSTVNCTLNVDCGFFGVLKDQYGLYINVLSDSDFKNGLDEIGNNYEIVDNFFNNIQNKVIDSSIQYTLKNSPVFKIINNIFMLKIHHYGLKKIQFVKYIYKYFDNYETNNNVNKNDMINNYKTIINMIYENYTVYNSINNVDDNFYGKNLISKFRFSEILNKYTTDDILKMILSLEKTIKDIEDFKQIYRQDITDDIEIEKNENKLFSYFVVVFMLSSIAKMLSYILGVTSLCDNKPNKNVYNTFLLILSVVCGVVMFNTILYSHWFKSSVDISFKESIILDSNNKFTNKLHDMHQYLKYLYDVKKLDNDNVENLSGIFDKFNIKYFKYEDNELNQKVLLFSKYNSGNDYTILDRNDIINLISSELYTKTSDVIRLYECCSFLKETKDKKVILPYQEISINIIYLLITLFVFFYIFSDPGLNPFILFENILQLNKEIKIRKNVQKGSGRKLVGGESNSDKSIINIEENTWMLLYIFITFISIKFTELLYRSNVEYETSLYK